jgi:hypothetical protein
MGKHLWPSSRGGGHLWLSVPRASGDMKNCPLTTGGIDSPPDVANAEEGHLWIRELTPSRRRKRPCRGGRASMALSTEGGTA